MTYTVVEKTIETQTHGRFLLSPGADSHAPILLGFHGYGETAEEHLQRLRAIPGIEKWMVVSVQGLHQFYRRRTDEIVASWMTRQNRELAIADNLAYVRQVIGSLTLDTASVLVVAGFSQGVAMAYRTAASLDAPVSGVIACGGDVPPELNATALGRIPAALIGRGLRDDWYTAEKAQADQTRLLVAGVRVQKETFDTGHEWPPQFAETCSLFLQTSLASSST